jgi:hypothetical protein
MAYCYKHSHEHDFLGSCPHCGLEEELKEQSRINERNSREQIRATEAASQAQIEALEEDARRREELHYEALAEQERIAEAAIIEQKRIAQKTLQAQQYNLANAWRLEAIAKVDKALEMLNAGMFEQALDLAQQGIGEKGVGDPGNIPGHFIIAASLAALDRADEAEKYVSSMIKLLATPQYCDNPETHKIVFDKIPKNDYFLQQFSSIVNQNAAKWKLSHEFLSLIEELVNHDLIDDAENLAQICIAKLEENFLPLEHFSVIHKFSTLNLREKAVLAAQITIRNAPKILENKDFVNLANLAKVLTCLIMSSFLTEAKTLVEIMIKHNNLFRLQILRQEIFHRSGKPFDKRLKNFLTSVSSDERDSIFNNLDAFAEVISPTTLSFAKLLVNERFNYWMPSIEEELKTKALEKEGYNSTFPVKLMTGAFVSSVLCFPIGLIVNSVWGYKIYQKYSKLKNAKTEAQFLLEKEAAKWQPILNRKPLFSQLKFSLNTPEVIVFFISLSVAVLIPLGLFFNPSSTNMTSLFNPRNQVVSLSNGGFNKSFEGTINSNYAIKLNLTKQENRLFGEVVPKNGSSQITVNGTIDAKGNFYLKEFDTQKRNTGIYQGIINSDGLIQGNWMKPDGTSKRPILLQEVRNN